jgi:hypothetical protein
LASELDIELLAAFLDHTVDQTGDGREVHDFGGFFGRAELAIEVPEVGAFGQIRGGVSSIFPTSAVAN